MDEYKAEIEVKKIHANPNNPRFEAGDVTELAASIKANGLLQELLVRPAPELSRDFGNGHYMLEDGYRRWVACKQVLKVVPVRVRIPAIGENMAIRALMTGLVTGSNSVPLTAMERAKAYGRLRDEFGMTQEQIAESQGLTGGSISRYLMLLELSPKSQNDVRTGKLGVERAIEVIKGQRAKDRKREGKKPVDVGWDPDPFSASHPLAKKAKTMCETREHSGRRRFAGGCHACWEMVIRIDQDKVNQARMKDADTSVVFQPPIPDLPNGAYAATKSNGLGGS